MPRFVIKTHNDRHLVIEADRYNFNVTERSYDFFKKNDQAGTNRVATIFYNPANILGIVEADSDHEDFYFHDEAGLDSDYSGPDEDICDECQLADEYGDLLESQVFWDAVCDIIERWHEPSEVKPVPVPETPTAVPDQATVDPIQHWRDKNGEEWWGFETPKGFVHCDSLDFARTCYKIDQEDGPNGSGWAYLDLTGATRLS